MPGRLKGTLGLVATGFIVGAERGRGEIGKPDLVAGTAGIGRVADFLCIGHWHLLSRMAGRRPAHTGFDRHPLAVSALPKVKMP